MNAATDTPPQTRDGYRYWLDIPTRWMDNDIYGHVNNVNYYSYFDTVIGHYLVHEGGLDIHRGAVIGVCAESHCRFRDSFTFPEAVAAGLRVGRLGRRSARYEIGLFRQGAAEAAASGYFVHVFVARESMRPEPVPPRIRAALLRILAPGADVAPA